MSEGHIITGVNVLSIKRWAERETFYSASAAAASASAFFSFFPFFCCFWGFSTTTPPSGASSWSVLRRGGQAWRTRIDGPALQDAKGEEQEELLAQKLAFCSVMFNLEESLEQDRERKAAILEELLDFTRQNLPAMSRTMVCDLVEMVG